MICGDLAGLIPRGGVRCDGGDDGDTPVARDGRRHVTQSPHVLHPVTRSEAEIGVQTMTHVVAIKNYADLAPLCKLVLEMVGHRAFATAGETGEEHDTATLLENLLFL